MQNGLSAQLLPIARVVPLHYQRESMNIRITTRMLSPNGMDIVCLLFIDWICRLLIRLKRTQIVNGKASGYSRFTMHTIVKILSPSTLGLPKTMMGKQLETAIQRRQG